MFDFILRPSDFAEAFTKEEDFTVGGSRLFWVAKRIFDIFLSILLLPLLVVFLVVVFIMNPFKNPGPIFFAQKRMGRGCEPFTALKFRSMSAVEKIERGPDDPIEHHRISNFGRLLRKSRVDELPQILNVLKGEMSLIGPRPDYYEHAMTYIDVIPEYRVRHAVRPGISGLAQVELGYIEGSDATREKARQDIEYIQNAGFALDTKITLKTLSVVLGHRGA